MSTPTDKPVDAVTVSLSDSDFCRIVGGAMESEILKSDYKGRIEVTEVQARIEDDGWDLTCLFIPEEGS